MLSDIAIDIKGLGKSYYTYKNPRDILKKVFITNFFNLLGVKTAINRDEFWAVRKITIEIKKGDVIGIIGKNGSGKSTLLQIISGILSPSEGEVVVNGRIASILELGSGFNPEFTGIENIYFNAALYGLSRKVVDQKLQKIIEFADIGEFINQPIKNYSTGMTVRLGFAIIAHLDADILVVDETLSVGDAYFVQKCMRFLRKFIETGTLLFCTHDTAAVLNLCNKAILMSRGEMILSGTPKEVVGKYLLGLNDKESIENYSQLDSELKHSSHIVGESALSEVFYDARDEVFKNSNLRNEIKVIRMPFGENGIGTGDAIVEAVNVRDENRNKLAWAVGGENMILEIKCRAYKDLIQPIIGFQIKDRLGQVLFCDNTYITYKDEKVEVPINGTLTATFKFKLPYLRIGEYSISSAIASGTQEQHTQHHWVNDALIFSVQKSSVIDGLIGLGMQDVQINVALEK